MGAGAVSALANIAVALRRAGAWLGWMTVSYTFAALSLGVIVLAAPDALTVVFGASCLGAVSLVPSLTIARGHKVAFLLALPLLVVAAGYQGVTAYEYFGRTLATKAAKAGKADTTYARALADLTRLRNERAGIATVRSKKEIEADLWDLQTKVQTAGSAPAKGRTAPEMPPPEAVRVIMAELGAAERREKLDADIRAAEDKYARSEPSASGGAGKTLTPLLGWINARAPLTLETPADLLALLALVVIEVGSWTLPVVVALLRRKERLDAALHSSQFEREVGPVPPAPATPESRAELAGITGKAAPAELSQEARVVAQWCQVRLAPPSGGWSRSAVLYRDYAEWCARQRHTALPQGQWGAVMNQDLGHAGRKRGKAGNRCYQLSLVETPRQRAVPGHASPEMVM